MQTMKRSNKDNIDALILDLGLLLGCADMGIVHLHYVSIFPSKQRC